MNWMDLPEEYTKENSYFKILPISYEQATTYGDGASKGPEEIIKASKHLEYYEDQFNNEPFTKGIHILPELKLNSTPEDMVKQVSETVSNQKGFLVSLGGDHAITIGTVKGLEEDFSVIVFDAHSDFRNEWNGSKLNHACVSKQISKNHDLALIGIRSQDIEEHNEITNNSNIHQLKSYDFSVEKLKELLPKLKEKVYISIDVDVFDPPFLKNTGTPEPGGLQWDQIINSLEEIFKQKEVIGADIVEFAPKENFRTEAYSLARLVYKIFSLKLKNILNRS
ncbi:agmatinase [Candidatus Woesearchaeota archaeon]|mgnify:CR=1 FL=1|nr:agmatinase [Candidatus Woesearchaeota archaeon]MBT3438381.1 agmatinase [Candidatus Woesearchaeota archaeon]MBT4058364.1 agmatinase [Candidatus Woesearchaeota archaeon]MBT4207610.1 agmatinase [Candidatus Woesearchaeota archaeon]MBT4730627.1 agmatinase [Candidatus Woesearchaeota archaeon]